MRTVFSLLLLAALAGASSAGAEIVTCSSDGHEQNYCRVDTRDGVVLVHQLSKSGCWQGDTWGYDRGGIWVSNGCRAEFQIGRSGRDYESSLYHNSGSSDSVNWNDRRDVDRWSHDYSQQSVHSESHKDDKAGAAVGAALAVGVLAAIAANNDHHDGRREPARTYVCESLGKDHRYCDVGTIHHAEVKRQLSRNPCEYNRSWGYDRRGIWVGDGCRAEFWVE